jgi:hypothetical protein
VIAVREISPDCFPQLQLIFKLTNYNKHLLSFPLQLANPFAPHHGKQQLGKTGKGGSQQKLSLPPFTGSTPPVESPCIGDLLRRPYLPPQVCLPLERRKERERGKERERRVRTMDKAPEEDKRQRFFLSYPCDFIGGRRL